MVYTISLTQSQNNRVGIQGCGEPSNFTWQIRNVDHNIDVVFYVDDYSDNPYYWNGFDIYLSPTHSGLTAGIIQIPNGTYEFNVYQMQEPYDLDINNALALVETGVAYINDKN